MQTPISQFSACLLLGHDRFLCVWPGPEGVWDIICICKSKMVLFCREFLLFLWNPKLYVILTDVCCIVELFFFLSFSFSHSPFVLFFLLLFVVVLLSVFYKVSCLVFHAQSTRTVMSGRHTLCTCNPNTVSAKNMYLLKLIHRQFKITDLKRMQNKNRSKMFCHKAIIFQKY